MKPKYFIYLLPIALIVAANFYWGSVISWFLSIAICASLLYYAVRLAWEDRVNAMLLSFKKEDARLPLLQQVNEKWKGVMGFSLLAVLFASAVFMVIKTTRPGGRHPWFLNNEYHSISHSGIAGQALTLFPGNDPQNGQIRISTQGSQATLSFNNCLTPVMATTDGKQRLLNAIFPQDVQHGFTIATPASRLTVTLQPAKSGFFKRLLGRAGDRTIYELHLATSDAALLAGFNLAAPFEDRIVLEGPALEKGMSLFQLFLNNSSFESRHSESYQLLEAMLLPLKETYLLADDGDTYALHLAPGKGFFEAGYQLSVNGQPVAPKRNTTATLAGNEHFFIGFNNVRQQLYVAPVNGADYGLPAGETMALLFDFPPQYLLKSPGEQPAGSKNFRFLTNDFSELTDGSLTEGFYFQNYNLGSDYKVRGSMEYTSQKPGVPLTATVTDYLKGNRKQEAGSHFSLASGQPGVSFLFSVRDFSNHGFSTGNILIYLSVTFLLFTLLTVFFPGKKVDRVEPVILAVVFALLSLRYLLFWRMATFPPLENISKHELENTLLRFDFSLGGLSLPVPLTLLWTALFVLFLILFRRRQRNPDALLPGPKWQRFFQTPAALYKSFGVFMGACLLLFFLNKNVLHAEVLTRVVSILVPLLGYCYFSMVANRYYEQAPMPLRSGEPRFLTEVKAYVFYLFRNPTFVLTCISLLFFALADRGFAILFALFILLKNIFVNFLKNRLDTSKTSFGRMLLKPNNHWVFGLLALVAYLAILAYKPLFYHLLYHKLWVLFGVLAALGIIVWAAFPNARKIRLGLAGALGVYLLLLLIPATRHSLDAAMSSALKHVSYRAAIITQPLNQMLQAHPYSSFATRKIIETAENQWFINAYISKPYDPHATFNLRPFSKVGVDYPTQTRDVITARFLVGELGNFTMYLILLLCILPLVLWLTAYRLARYEDSAADKAGTVASYAGLIPLLLFFTLALFVWLTSTNRFVFFGQDFPFLSLTSRLSVLLPLLLLAFTLVQQPAPHLSTRINLQAHAVKYVFFFGLIAFFALVTVQKNELDTSRFNVAMTTTETHLDKDLNAVLDGIQDSLQNKRVRYTYQQLITTLGQSKAFDSLKNKVVQDPYTRSILENLVTRPASAFTLNNPLFIVYDNGRYQAVYNQNLYLQLPVIESRSVWNGKVLESIAANNLADARVFLEWKNARQYATLPFYTEDPATGVQLALLPSGWIAGSDGPVGILSGNANKGKELFIYQNKKKVMLPVALRFAQTLQQEDVALATAGSAQNRISFHNQGRSFAFNKWVNGRYKIIYPLGAGNFWIYHFANGIRANYSNDNSLVRNEAITLDYALTQSVGNILAAQAQPLADKQRSYSFSVIAADGDGRIRLMQDVVGNRQALDPNDEATIYQLQQQQFFFSNARNERDQWGNRNLLHLFLGPGSSIKPLFAALVASGVNAGWEALQLNPAPAEVTNYAGLALRRPWKNVDHYGGIVDMATYIEASSNFYQGLMMFLGTYTRQDFVRNNSASLAHVLSKAANTYPALQWQGQRYYLPAYNNRKGNWPVTDPAARHRTFFGNSRSLIATGFESNAGLATTQDFNDQDQPNFVQQNLYRQWRNTGAGFLWAFPESSAFLQENRAYASIQENFNVGLKTAALGGYPYQVTPFKMLEMYLGMAAYNKDFHLHVNGGTLPATPWQKDATWGAGAFEGFLARQILGGMARVINGGYGTAKRLSVLKGSHPGLYFYAKTGTINEEASGVKSSRRLVVLASDKDLTQPENIGRAKTFGWFFAVDNTGDFDWPLLLQILESTMNAASFQNYFQQAGNAAAPAGPGAARPIQP